jgi:hypothetical protein
MVLGSWVNESDVPARHIHALLSRSLESDKRRVSRCFFSNVWTIIFISFYLQKAK